MPPCRILHHSSPIGLQTPRAAPALVLCGRASICSLPALTETHDIIRRHATNRASLPGSSTRAWPLSSCSRGTRTPIRLHLTALDFVAMARYESSYVISSCHYVVPVPRGTAGKSLQLAQLMAINPKSLPLSMIVVASLKKAVICGCQLKSPRAASSSHYGIALEGAAIRLLDQLELAGKVAQRHAWPRCLHVNRRASNDPHYT